MQYAFMAAHREEFAITVMCRVLAVSSSGYYDWLGREPSQRQQDDALLTAHIRQLHTRSR